MLFLKSRLSLDPRGLSLLLLESFVSCLVLLLVFANHLPRPPQHQQTARLKLFVTVALHKAACGAYIQEETLMLLQPNLQSMT